jgi:hypothetical protein
MILQKQMGNKQSTQSSSDIIIEAKTYATKSLKYTIPLPSTNDGLRRCICWNCKNEFSYNTTFNIEMEGVGGWTECKHCHKLNHSHPTKLQ